MSEYRVAYRYAKSLLNLSIETKSTEVVYQDMIGMDQLINVNRDFVLFLRSPIIKRQRKVPIIRALFEGKVDKLTATFLELLVAKGRAAILYAVTKEFQRLYLDLKGIQTAKVTTIFQLEDSLRGEFEKLVNQISKKEPQLEEEVDEDIIGGFILNVGDRRIDSSMRSQLRKIDYELTP